MSYNQDLMQRFETKVERQIRLRREAADRSRQRREIRTEKSDAKLESFGL